eukprot:scaffold259_cov578-Prasinococcus_capsulatus_cf.AAC.3
MSQQPHLDRVAVAKWPVSEDVRISGCGWRKILYLRYAIEGLLECRGCVGSGQTLFIVRRQALRYAH